MRIHRDQLEKLKKTRKCVDITRSKSGDYVYDGIKGIWFCITKIFKISEDVYIMGVDPNTLRVIHQKANVCFPSWNPLTKNFGRSPGETRSNYWLP